jgi:hypothetical protein
MTSHDLTSDECYDIGPRKSEIDAWPENYPETEIPAHHLKSIDSTTSTDFKPI